MTCAKCGRSNVLMSDGRCLNQTRCAKSRIQRLAHVRRTIELVQTRLAAIGIGRIADLDRAVKTISRHK